MKLLLIHPPQLYRRTTGPPLGLCYLAACSEKEGHNVKIIDSLILKYKFKNIKREIEKFDPDVIGVYSSTEEIPDAYTIIKLAKEYNPNILTVMGGPHPSLLPEKTLITCPQLDVIVRGEGELTFLELLEKFEKNEDFHDINGITFRKDDKIYNNPDRPLIQDLDSIPFPAYHLVPMKKYKVILFDNEFSEKQGKPYATIVTSRGCPYTCTFCSSAKIWHKKWRARSPENVVEELKILRQKYGKKVISFMDDTFTLNKQRAIQICRLIVKEDLDISWANMTRVDVFTKELAIEMKKAGILQVCFGIESGVQKTIDMMCKGFNLKDVERAVKIAKEAEIKIIGFFMIGIPGETKEMINQTIEFNKRLDIDASRYNIYIPHPGSALYEYAEKNNLLPYKDWWLNYTKHDEVIKIPGISKAELEELRIKAYKTLSSKRLADLFNSK